jgi:hypothetical protein
MIQELKRAVKKIRQNVVFESLKVVTLGPIDCIACRKMMETI